jgi:hypothetical protein
MPVMEDKCRLQRERAGQLAGRPGESPSRDDLICHVASTFVRFMGSLVLPK